MSHTPGSTEDFADQVRAEVDDLLDETGYDPLELAASIEPQLDREGADTFDPPDEAFWRGVVAELRRRAGGV